MSYIEKDKRVPEVRYIYLDNTIYVHKREQNLAMI